jgi:hypothetical protein
VQEGSGINNLSLDMLVLKEDEVRGCAIRLHKVPSSFLSFLFLSLWVRLLTGLHLLCLPSFLTPSLSSLESMPTLFSSLLLYLLSTFPSNPTSFFDQCYSLLQPPDLTAYRLSFSSISPASLLEEKEMDRRCRRSLRHPN